jgi:YegS/Rv2252/BmrU family lipid kinase
MKHYFIVNPAAGRGKDPKALIERIKAACLEKATDFEIYLTTRAGDATEFVRKKCESAIEKLRFFSCGGDGTNNEVISGAMGYDCAEVGFVPDGTGNDFIKCFENPDNFSDISAQLDGSAEEIDIISCNDKHIMNIMNIGFDCEVVRRTAKIKKLPLVSKSMAYILGVVGELISKTGVKMKVSLDGGEPVDKELLLATFSNGRYYGGGFNAAPKARLCDGLMDVCLVKNISRTRFIGLVSHYRSGDYLDLEKFKSVVEFFRCREVKLEFEKEQSICIDGELFEGKIFNLKLLPRALKILIPHGSAFSKDEIVAPAAFMC